MQDSRRLQKLEQKITELQRLHSAQLWLHSELDSSHALAEQQDSQHQFQPADIFISTEDATEDGATTGGTTKLIMNWIQRFTKNPTTVLEEQTPMPTLCLEPWCDELRLPQEKGDECKKLPPQTNIDHRLVIALRFFYRFHLVFCVVYYLFTI